MGDGTVEFAFGSNSVAGTQGYTMPMTVLDSLTSVSLSTPNLELQGLVASASSQLFVLQNASVVTAAALGGTISDFAANASLSLLDGGNISNPVVLESAVGLRNEATLTIANALQIGDSGASTAVLFNDGTALLKDGATITVQGSGKIVNGPTAVLVAQTSGTLDVPAPVVNFGSIAVRSGTLKLDQRVTTPGTLTSSIEVFSEAVLELGHFAAADTMATVDAAGILRIDSLPMVTDATVNARIGAGIVIANFVAAGTRILTRAGEVAVEDLRVGDFVLAHGGDGRITPQPVVWVGHRAINCRRHPNPREIWPVRITAGAFGIGRPFRDLWLSPDHAVFMSDVLIPIRHLINETTVTQEHVDSVTYFHVELPTHAVLLAEGLPAESYLDTGNRDAFDQPASSVRAAWSDASVRPVGRYSSPTGPA